VFFGHRFLIKPKLEELAGVESQDVTLRTEFETQQKKVAALDAYRAQLSEMQVSFGAMLKQLPSKSEVANLLNDVSQTRVAAGLEETLFQPQSEVLKEFYAELPINIEVTGTYHEMGAFTSDVAALPRIVTIGNVEIRPQDKSSTLAPTASPAGPPPSARLQIKLVAKTYRYLDADEQATQDAKAAAKK
jgi:type IV pilus assembly protein PilO